MGLQVVDSILVLYGGVVCDCASNTLDCIHSNSCGSYSVYDFLDTLRVRGFFCVVCGVLVLFLIEDN